MDRQAIIAKLRENEAALKARGVSHAALFGSRARGESRPGSDIDILVEIEPSYPMDVFQYVGVVHAIEDLFAFVEGLTHEQFRVSPLHVYGVTRALEIISEASCRLPDGLREHIATYPWRSIWDVGNFYLPAGVR